MNNDVNSTNNLVDADKQATSEAITELSEDMEMVSPGAMLREARKSLSLSQEHIARKLNFKLGLVKDIEQDVFDPTMPVTFNRGYLANYAKLVSVAVEDVLASYDALDAANIQRSEMLSFSKQTAKQAEHSRVMWLSYFIVAVLIGLTVLWWQQEGNHQQGDGDDSQLLPNVLSLNTQGNSSKNSNSVAALVEKPAADEQAPSLKFEEEMINTDAAEQGVINETASDTEIVTQAIQKSSESELSQAVFTFSGDCWVNIYDATGKRIAWGVKKTGYVMTIKGKAPLRITVGKPELTSIVFNGQTVDMSPFNVGNIAKFTLPVAAE